MLLSSCEFRDNQSREGCAFLTAVGGIISDGHGWNYIYQCTPKLYDVLKVNNALVNSVVS
jgi:hypothetical protein